LEYKLKIRPTANPDLENP